MSAYMVDREHVHFLVDAACSLGAMGSRIQGDSLHWYWTDAAGARQHGELRIGDYGEASRVGQLLWDENRRSIEARYPDTVGHMENAPGPIGETFFYGEHGPNVGGRIKAEQVIKSCRCYAYQACEHAGWASSEAKAFVDALEAKAVWAILVRGDWVWGAPEGWEANCVVRLPDGAL